MSNYERSIEQFALDIAEKTSVINVSQVSQLSPFRYPGGKTWLVPEVRRWLATRPNTATNFVEPFAGGAMCGLSVAAEKLVNQVILVELDSDVAAVWTTIFSGANEDVDWLCNRIETFEVSEASVRLIIDDTPALMREVAFRTIIKNRMQRGGILAAGAGLMKAGENGNGLMSRWYPTTLVKRINALKILRNRVQFVHGNAFDVIAQHSHDPNVAFLVDPPYTAGGKKAGNRLYTHHAIDHNLLFQRMATVQGSVMMTYDDAIEVHQLAEKYGFSVSRVPMKSSHHEIHKELVLTKN